MKMRKQLLIWSILAFIIPSALLSSCQTQTTETETETEQTQTTDNTPGTLQLRANGEDFVREGFVSKDGWESDF